MNQQESSNLKKYNSKNPLKRYLIKKYMQNLVKLAALRGSERICDIGCGEGIIDLFLLSKYPNLRIEGYDISREAVGIAKVSTSNTNVEYNVLDVMECGILTGNKYDVILFLEVLEHLRDYEQALNKLAGLRFNEIIISVPNEPWFSFGNLLFGKNIMSLGKDKDHSNFFNKKNLTKILSPHFEIKSILRSFPWLLYKCRQKT